MVRNLAEKDLDELFGFIEAFVICPNDMHKPFLPYKNRDGILIFPIGKFVGVYFSEELKHATGIVFSGIFSNINTLCSKDS